MLAERPLLWYGCTWKGSSASLVEVPPIVNTGPLRLVSGPWPALLMPPARLSTACLPWGGFFCFPRTYMRRYCMTDRDPSLQGALPDADRASGRDVVFMAVAAGVALPWLGLRLTGFHGDPA